MTKDEALRKALEALEEPKEHIAKHRRLEAITAIKEVLAQPEQKPFGHVTVRRLSQRFENHHDQYQFYPAGQSPYLDNVDECHTVYTTPPQRTWVGLTDEDDLDWEAGDSLKDLVKAIEAKLKQKNGYAEEKNT